MKFVPGNLYKLVYPIWLVQMSCRTKNGKMIIAKQGTLFLYLEKKRNQNSIKEDSIGSPIYLFWFLNSDGIKINFLALSEKDLGSYFREMKL